MARRLLVTRPEPGASRTAERLRALGFDPVVLPLTEIIAHEPEAIGDAAFDVVAVSSANALRQCPGDLITRLRHLPCHAVGGATASMARETGFTNVIDADGDGETLAAALCQLHGAGTRFVYLCGRVRAPVLEERLSQCGMIVTAIETYDTKKVSYMTDTLRRMLGAPKLDGILVYSVAGAEAVMGLVAEPILVDHIDYTTYFCLSKRIAAVLTDTGNAVVAVAEEPTEAALLELVRRTL